VSEHAHGTKGVAEMVDHQRFLINGESVGDRRRGQSEDGHQLEHFTFFENIRSGKVRNDAEVWREEHSQWASWAAWQLTRGRFITWDQALNSKEILVPDIEDWNAEPPLKPTRKDGIRWRCRE